MLPRFLLDTHVLVRSFIAPKKRSREQARVIDGAVRRGEPLTFSAVSLMEIAVLTSYGRLKLNSTLDEFFAHLRSSPAFQLLPLSYEVALDIASLGRALGDPADRAIVATARVHRLRLVTSDQRIIESKLVAVVD